MSIAHINNLQTAQKTLQGRELIQRVRRELTNARQQKELLELIEAILFYKLPQVSRKERRWAIALTN